MTATPITWIQQVLSADEAEVARATGAWASAAASPEDVLLRDSVDDRLQLALEAMPKALRDAVWLRDVEDLTYAEIAARLRVPIGTVMSRISRGRRQLHRRLASGDGAGAQQPSDEGSGRR